MVIHQFNILLIQVFTGNTDRDTVVFNEMFPPITARFIRFRPLSWNGDIGLRMELYGCKGMQFKNFLITSTVMAVVIVIDVLFTCVDPSTQ